MTVVAVNGILAGLALLGGLVGVLLVVMLLHPAGRERLRRELAGRGGILLAVAWVAVALATGGSLYYSEVVGYPPCLLCWWQRIAMYPLVLVLGVALLRSDLRVGWYVVPVSAAGFLISAYHVALQHRPALDVVTCAADAPCTARYVAEYGFVSIPFMAGLGFLLVTALTLAAPLGSSREG